MDTYELVIKKKDTCYKEIGLWVQSIDIILGLITDTIGKVYYMMRVFL